MKTIKISEKNWEKLSKKKLSARAKSIDKIIEELLKEEKKQ